LEERGLAFDAWKGRFVLSDVGPGRYAVTVSVPGYNCWTREEIRLSRDEPDAALDVRLNRSEPWGTVRVTVRAPSGEPAEGLDHEDNIFLYNPESGFLTSPRDLFMASFHLVSADAPKTPQVIVDPLVDFDVEIASLPLFGTIDSPVGLDAPAGRHILVVRVHGYVPVTRVVDVQRETQAEVTVVLQAAGHVHVSAAFRDGEPALDYRLAVFDTEGEELAYDLRNRFGTWWNGDIPGTPHRLTPRMNQLIPVEAELQNLVPGRYRLVATKEGLGTAEATVDVKASATVKARLILR
jgi:hypothetical protein